MLTNEVTSKMNAVEKQLMGTIEEIEVEKKKKTSSADKYEKAHFWTTVLISILAAIAPALVTYQAQTSSEAFKFVAIILVALAGSIGTLQSGFKFNQRSARSRLTALNLNELESSAKLQKARILMSNDEIDVLNRLNELSTKIFEQSQIIMRAHIESETSIISKDTNISHEMGKRA